MNDTDALAEATEFIAQTLIDGVDLDVLIVLARDEPKVAGLVMDLALADLRRSIPEDLRATYARALRFSILAQLSGLDTEG